MKYIIIVCLLLSVGAKGQYYIMAAPNIAFNTPLRDAKNLFGGTIEVGRYFGDAAIGINSGWWTFNKKDFYQELMATVPIYMNFSVSAAIGYMYYHKDVTMEYDINYTLPINKTYSFVISYSAQSALGSTASAYSIGINKDFKIK